MMKTITLIDEVSRRWPTLNTERMQILCFIAENPGVCMQNVADALEKDKNTIWHICNTLANGHSENAGHGLLKIKQDSGDKRLRRLTLTRKGKEAYHLFAQLSQPLNEELKKRDDETLDLFEK